MAGIDIQVILNFFSTVVIIFVSMGAGYFGVKNNIFQANMMSGLGRILGTYALPALLFKALGTLDFNKFEYVFFCGILLGKFITALLAISISYIAGKNHRRKRRFIEAGLRGIASTQSNDFALALPIVVSLFGETNPEYYDYVFISVPISAIIINPLCFIICEYGFSIPDDYKDKKYSEIEEQKKHMQHMELGQNPMRIHLGIKANETFVDIKNPLDKEDTLNTESGIESNQKVLKEKVTQAKRVSVREAQLKGDDVKPKDIKNVKDIEKKSGIPYKLILIQVITNPIVAMTIFGLLVNGLTLITKGQIPELVIEILTKFGAMFPTGALIMLGVNMASNMDFSDIDAIFELVMVNFFKLIICPVLCYTFVGLLGGNEDLKNFCFILGAAPMAPTVTLYAARYTQPGKGPDYNSQFALGVIMSTIVGVIIMTILVIALQLLNSSVTSTQFSGLTWMSQLYLQLGNMICLIWTMLAFLVDNLFNHPKFRDLTLLCFFTLLRGVAGVTCWHLETQKIGSLFWKTLFGVIGMFGQTLCAGNMAFLVYEHSRYLKWYPGMNNTAICLSMSGMVLYTIIAMILYYRYPNFQPNGGENNYLINGFRCIPEVWEPIQAVTLPAYSICFLGSIWLLNQSRLNSEKRMKYYQKLRKEQTTAVSGSGEYAIELSNTKPKNASNKDSLTVVHHGNSEDNQFKEPEYVTLGAENYERKAFDDEDPNRISKRLAGLVVYLLFAMFVSIIASIASFASNDGPPRFITFLNFQLGALQGYLIFLLYGIDSRLSIVSWIKNTLKKIFNYLSAEAREANPRAFALMNAKEIFTFDNNDKRIETLIEESDEENEDFEM